MELTFNSQHFYCNATLNDQDLLFSFVLSPEEISNFNFTKERK